MDAPADSREVSLGIPAKPEYLVLVRLALSAVCRLTPLGPDEVADLKLAVTEAATSRVQPDQPGDEESPELRVGMRLDEDRLEVTLRGGTTPAVEDEERELSRAIIEATVDSFDEGGDSTVLVKHLAGAPG
ncbi:MAG: serine/threonine-protein kinase RsbW [Thermoleophilaceae bacterium]|jgi:serine/threonine-protein kinase RsbW|nr:serine/threonine-protein kinase RsbW [Thermoleophilaceae bacterium]